MRVGRGTYVRSLAVDLGRALGVGASVSYLLRMRSGMFTLTDAYTIGDLKEASQKGRLAALFSDPLEMLWGVAKFQIKNSSVGKVIHGVQLGYEDFEKPHLVSLHSRAMGPFLAYEVNETGAVRITAVMQNEEPYLTYDKVLTRESDTGANSRSRKRR